VQTLKGTGADVVYNQSVPPTATDVSSQTQQIASSHPDVVISTVADPLAIELGRGLSADGVNVPIIASAAATSATTLTLKNPNFYIFSPFALAGPGFNSYVNVAKAAGLSASLPGEGYGYQEGLAVIGALKACSGCSGQALIDAFDRLNYDTGGFSASNMTFTPTNHVGVTSALIFHWDAGSQALVQFGPAVPLG